MLNPLSFISKIFKSNNDIELANLRKILEKINSLENDVIKIKDHDFPNKTEDLKNEIKNGKIVDLLDKRTDSKSFNLNWEAFHVDISKNIIIVFLCL